MFTKNFNSKVKATFNRNAAAITAIDTLTALQLVKYGQFYFDLTELYTRKFRKEMYEQKGAFSDISFFQPIFNRLQEELQTENARVSKATALGSEEELLKSEHQMVLQQIEQLSAFCMECEPPRRKKRKQYILHCHQGMG